MPPTSTATDARDTAEMLKAIDQLTEQNRQLEKQNQQLMDQITALRQTLAEHHGGAPSGDALSPASSVAAKDSSSEIIAARTHDGSSSPARSTTSAVVFEPEYQPEQTIKWVTTTSTFGV